MFGPMMTNLLRREEIQFLAAQGIDAIDVFDGSHLRSSVAQQRMRETGQAFYIGSPCRSAGHRIRTRAGHCIQCNTANIAYYLRHRDYGHIYAAHSKLKSWIKVGVSKSPDRRIEILNSISYGGTSDWIILFHQKTGNVGLVEANIHKALQAFKISTHYHHDGHLQRCSEIFAYDPNLAIDIIKRNIGIDG
jgi:hypothetical protein